MPLKLKDRVNEELTKKPSTNPYRALMSQFQNIIDTTDKSFETIESPLFANKNPLHLEIGSGSGNFLKTMAEENPSINFIGVDLRFKRLVSSANKSKDFNNIVFIKGRGENVDKILKNNPLDHLYIFFPDPWPKKRHKKNRLVNAQFLKKISNILKNNGIIEIKSDHGEYFDFMIEEIKKSPYEVEELSRDLYSEKSLDQSASEFEQMFYNQGLKINYVRLRKSEKI